jgi:hypothetical protein
MLQGMFDKTYLVMYCFNLSVREHLKQTSYIFFKYFFSYPFQGYFPTSRLGGKYSETMIQC